MDNKNLVYMAAKACDEKKAKDIKLIKIDKVSFIKNYGNLRLSPLLQNDSRS